MQVSRSMTGAGCGVQGGAYLESVEEAGDLSLPNVEREVADKRSPGSPGGEGELLTRRSTWTRNTNSRASSVSEDGWRPVVGEVTFPALAPGELRPGGGSGVCTH